MSHGNPDKMILLVEDNPRDAELTLRALRKSNLMNPIMLARDGAEALDFLFSQGEHADRPLLFRGSRSGRELSLGSKQLRSKAGGLCGISGCRATAGSVLAGAQSSATCDQPILVEG